MISVAAVTTLASAVLIINTTLLMPAAELYQSSPAGDGHYDIMQLLNIVTTVTNLVVNTGLIGNIE